MAVIDQKLTDKYAIYNGDSCEVLPTLPDASIGLSVYSPPFATPGGGALYHYSSSVRDLSNARTFDEFLGHYGFIVQEIHRVTKAGRMTAVHCADVPFGGCSRLFDLPGEIIRLHESMGFEYAMRFTIWKEPLGVRLRTMVKGLAHQTIIEDSSMCTNAGGDFLLVFRRKGENQTPIYHPEGLMEYAGEREIPTEVMRYRGHPGKQTENKYSQWIWRQYASCVWDDIRIDNVLPYRDARDSEDEKHVHPLQLDVIERCVQLWSNKGEAVLTPFMGVGSEVYGAVKAGRRGIGIELKSSYYRQAIKNMQHAETLGISPVSSQRGLFD
jgi:DNA modification methylase